MVVLPARLENLGKGLAMPQSKDVHMPGSKDVHMPGSKDVHMVVHTIGALQMYAAHRA